jgi:hypothetical protein
MDNHADTVCCGTNFVPIAETNYTVEVSPFTDSYDPIKDIPVCSCATAYDVPNGPTVILVFHQSLYFGDKLQHSLINPNQIRAHHGNIVMDHYFDPDKPAGIYHNDVSIPMHVLGTFTYFSSRSPTREELRSCEHIQMTSPASWNPSSMPENMYVSSLYLRGELPLEQQPNQVTEFQEDLRLAASVQLDDTHPHIPAPNTVEVRGDPIYDLECFAERLVATVQVPHWEPPREVSAVTAVDGELVEADIGDPNDLKVFRPHHSSERHPRVTPEQLSRHFQIGLQTAKDTIRVTTQRGIRSSVLPLSRRYRSDMYFNQKRLKIACYSDTMFGRCKSLAQNTAAQVFVLANGAIDCYPMSSKAQAGDALGQFITDWGAPNHMTVDGSGEQTGPNSKFQKLCRKHEIPLQIGEPNRHQNPCEPHIGAVRKKWFQLMTRNQVPKRLWDYGFKYICEVKSRIVSSRFGNNGRPPLEMITGETVDLSEYLDFGFYQWVYFKSGARALGENTLGRWLGVAHRIGNAMCYYVIDSKGEILVTSTVAAVPNLDLQTPAVKQLTDQFDADLLVRLNDENFRIPHNAELPDDSPHSWRQLWSDEDPDYNELHYAQADDSSIPEVDHIEAIKDPDEVYTPDLPGDPYIDMEVLLSSRDTGESLAKVVGRKRDSDGNPIGRANNNPILDTREYKVQFPDGHYETLAANVIAENLFASCDADGHRMVLLDEISDYRRTEDALTDATGWITKPNGTKYRRKSTKGWELLYQWKDGSSEWIPLKDAKNSHPVEVAEFAVANKISQEPAFAWWVPYVIRKRNRIISKVKKRYWQKSHKYGFELPKSVEHALQIDAKNGNHKWRDAIAEEMRNVSPAFEEWNKPLKDMLPGYSQIRCHFIFDIKLGENFRFKARYVAGGHVTEVDSSIMHSSVVSRDSVRIMFTLAALNDLDIQSCDIQNAYISAPCREKRYVIGGKEFGSRAGTIFIIVRALYGLKSAGSAFWSLLREKLSSMGFTPSKADPDVWMKPATIEDGFAYYQYICAYVDDLLSIAHKSHHPLHDLKQFFKLKHDKIAPPESFLGAEVKYRQSPSTSHMAWSIEGKKYIKGALANLALNLQQRELKPLPPSGHKTPFPSNYRAECDATPELDDKTTNWYQELIGILRWAIELGRIDIMFEVTALSAHLALPRQGHLDAAIHIFGYLQREVSRWILMDPTYPNTFPGQAEPVYSEWTEFYEGATEPIPTDAPTPRGKHVILTCFVDADHASNRVTRRSHTGIILMMNSAPIIWYSKRQNTVESSSFGSEFIAMRIAVDLIQALRYKLRMFGVPLGPNPDVPEPVTVLCDNQSVVTNSSEAQSKLNKKHNSIAFHRVRESVAAGWVLVTKVATADNWADLLTKALNQFQRKHLIDNFMY